MNCYSVTHLRKTKSLSIQLYKGEYSSKYTVDRKKLIIFLKGSKKEKLALQKHILTFIKSFRLFGIFVIAI